MGDPRASLLHRSNGRPQDFRLACCRSARMSRWLLGCFALFFVINAEARWVITEVTGTFNQSQENGCVLVSAFIYGVDCSYTRRIATVKGREAKWVGPTIAAVYYQLGSREESVTYVPEIGDRRIAPSLAGAITVDDRGTADPIDDLLSATLTIGAAMRSLATRTGPTDKVSRVVQRWRAIRHIMEQTPVTASKSLDSGGVRYTIASKGFPERICMARDREDCFPSARAPLTTDGQWGANTWAAPSTVPIARSSFMGGNIGAQTTAEVIQGYCRSISGGNECQRGVGVWGPAEDPGLDNLLLSVWVDDRGRVTKAAGFWTNEYRVGVGPKELRAPNGTDDSWLGGYLELIGHPDRAATYNEPSH